MARQRKRSMDDYKKLCDIRCKATLAIAVFVAFIIVLVRMLFFPSTILELANCGLVETFLGRTIYVAFKHYFPPANAGGS